MDRNTITGILLIAIVLIGYNILTKPGEEELKEMRRKKDSIARMQKKQEQPTQEKDTDSYRKEETPDKKSQVPEKSTKSATQDIDPEEYGPFADAAQGQQQFFTLENNLLKAKISNKGGRVYSVELKQYQTYDSADLILFNGDSNTFDLNFFAQNHSIATNELFFVPVSNDTHMIASHNEKTLKLRLKAGEDRYIEYVYTLQPDQYLLDFDINFVNMDEVIASNISSVGLNWTMKAPSLEKGRENENNYTSIYYKFYKDEVDNLRGRANSDQEEKLTTQLKWIAFKHQFFSSVLIADNSFSSGLVKYHLLEEETDQYLKKFIAKTTLPLNNTEDGTIPFTFYFGPNHFNTLKDHGMQLSELVDLGWWILKWINRYIIIPIFNFLDNYITNYGIIILILTVLIKIVLFPLTYKSYISMAKMKVLKPQLDEINNKYSKDQAMEKQRAQMNLYKKAGVSPMGGCLPLLLQMPILIAMYRFFPTSIELRQESFLWAKDLSTFDSIAHLPFEIPFYGDHVSLFTLLMAGTTILTMKFSNQASTSSSQMPGMKTMMYFMPVMLLFVLNSFSAALTYYLFLSNIITVGQNAISKKFIDEDAMLKKINENKKKPPKKSKFQEKLEEANKQRAAQKTKKKKA